MSNALPLHTVYVSAFELDTFEVTNSEYLKFLESALSMGTIEVKSGVVVRTSDGTPFCDTDLSSPYSRITWDGVRFGLVKSKEEHPMVMVSWFGAVAYANWRSVEMGLDPCYDLTDWSCDFIADGYRLPTEAEWEKAARGGEETPYFRYPWGDHAYQGSLANYWESWDPFETGANPKTTPVGYYDGSQIPVGSDMANGYGLYDMSGNVWEWCNDWYDESYYAISPGSDPKGPQTGVYRVIRGGAWLFGTSYLRCAYRTYGGKGPDLRYYALGFRLARR